MNKSEGKGQGNLLDRMIAVGAHFGYSKTRRHPSTKPFIYATKDRSDLIDLSKTEDQLEKAKTFLAEIVRGGKQVLFVGVKPEARDTVREIALSLRMPYVVERWIGGTLTNFAEIRRRVEKLHDLLDKKEKGELSVYTKKEQLLIERSIEKMDKNFGGLSDMKMMPAVVVLFDSRHEYIALTEANDCHIPVVSISNTDCSIDGITYPVVANDGSVASIKFFATELADAIRNSQVEK